MPNKRALRVDNPLVNSGGSEEIWSILTNFCLFFSEIFHPKVQGARLFKQARLFGTLRYMLFVCFCSSVPGISIPVDNLPPGLTLLLDVVDEQTEKQLLECIDWQYDDPALIEGKVFKCNHSG